MRRSEGLRGLRLMVALAVLVPGVARACPPVPDITTAMADLLNAARAAKTEREGRAVGARMWELWAMAPDSRAQAMLDRGLAAREAFDYDTARAAFDDLIDYCPDYAEGWNQRAFVSYLRRDYEAALGDLDRALALSPAHVAALAGKALSLMGLGRHVMAQEVLRDALKLNPWLSERALLREPPGQEL